MSSELGPMFCFDSKLRTPFQFKNASDALLARLSLSYGIEDIILDLFLSVVNDPEFNPKEVSIKHAADIHGFVSERRQENMDSLGKRSSQDMVNVTAGLPTVVLDGVIDVLKDEFEDAVAALRSRDGIGYASINPPSGCFGFVDSEREAVSASRLVLSTCCTVHTSWLGRAVHALGCSLITPPKVYMDPLSLYIRSPLYSTWTRNVEMAISYVEKMEGLASLFSRMPNVDFLQIKFTVTDIDERSTAVVRYASDNNCFYLCPAMLITI
ncbi:hypothetical protein SCHPADRAFT_143787 [Schizopora paradoxa]|uniref:Uncharacterized protein n=1 Tax=Schizopora paradoxa TaxID=27342 RepID=A0A0H2SL48_9AGAM|nr:hypothetical protein SCHPADRAFT_143787 [Schizopora paradoxa]